MMYRPDLTIDNDMLVLVSEISVLIDRIPKKIATPLHIRLSRDNHVRTIHSTSAIEGNKLSLEEVTEIIDGKRVIGSPDDIREIKNAKKAYDLMKRFDPLSVKDMLTAHGVLMNGLIDLPGEFRDRDVGVYKGPEAVHIAPHHDDVPLLVNDLMDWYRDADLHPLIATCVFHCRFEYIHPFIDGNGRMGRLWHSLMLSKWDAAFEHLPIESWINLNKKEYYRTLSHAHNEGDVSAFVKYMLLMIRMAVDEFVDEITYAVGKEKNVKEAILDMISGDPKVTAAGMAGVLGINIRTVKRHLSSLTNDGMVIRIGSDKTGHWKILHPPVP